LQENSSRFRELLARARQRVDDVKRLQAAGLICHDGDFVPSVHYPPITRYPPMTEEELFAGYSMPQDGLLDVYVHFPFCERRCTFCHYPGKLGEQTEEKNRYLSALEKEMDIYMRRLGIDRIHARSILIGGGTPTFLTPAQLERFLQFFSDGVRLSEGCQFNYDVDPGSLVGPVGEERLRIMKQYGVNRLTIGVQSLDDDVLRIMNRPHDAQMAIDSIQAARPSAISSILNSYSATRARPWGTGRRSWKRQRHCLWTRSSSTGSRFRPTETCRAISSNSGRGIRPAFHHSRRL